MTAEAGTAKSTTARQRAGKPATGPATSQPAAAEILTLGEGGEPMSAAEIQLALLQEQINDLRNATAQVPVQRRSALPTAASDPDILGLPGVKPLRLTTGDDDEQPVGRHALFYIDDVAVTIPDEVSSTVALNYMRIVGTYGDGEEDRQQAAIAGQSYLLEQMLGEDGYRRLCEYKQLTTAQMAWVIQVCNRIALGGLEVPKA